MKLTAAILATVALALVVGCSSAQTASVLPAPNPTSKGYCTQFAQTIPESQLFSYVGSIAKNPAVMVQADPSFAFTWIEIRNELVMSPALVTTVGQTLVDPRSTKQLTIEPPMKAFTVQQTFDNYDNGAGVQIMATECSENST